jgi:hypothetical protein
MRLGRLEPSVPIGLMPVAPDPQAALGSWRGSVSKSRQHLKRQTAYLGSKRSRAVNKHETVRDHCAQRQPSSLHGLHLANLAVRWAHFCMTRNCSPAPLDRTAVVVSWTYIKAENLMVSRDFHLNRAPWACTAPKNSSNELKELS